MVSNKEPKTSQPTRARTGPVIVTCQQNFDSLPVPSWSAVMVTPASVSCLATLGFLINLVS